MSVSNSVNMAFLVVVGTVAVLVRLSDSASVPISSFPTSNIPTEIFSSDDSTDLELLASSKILMDHTSLTFSTSTDASSNFRKADYEDDKRVAKNLKISDENGKFADISGTDSISSNDKKYEKASEQNPPQEKLPVSNSRGKTEQKSSEMTSCLNVARCRATCLQKFNDEVNRKRTTTTVATPPAKSSNKGLNATPDQSLLRFRRSSYSKIKQTLPTSTICASSDCITCWKSCETFETTSKEISTNGVTSDHFSSGGFPHGKDNEVKEKTRNPSRDDAVTDQTGNQQQTFDCHSLDPSQCSSGCQVACLFYEQFVTSAGESNKGSSNRPFKGDPVVTTKHESVMKLLPGKITWPTSSTPLSSREKDDSGTRAVVYVVIQEYPGRKWKQITQTFETSIDIPTELMSKSSAKLRSIRVFAVDPHGLMAVYSPEKIRSQVEQEHETKQDKGHGISASEKSTTFFTEIEAENNDREATKTAKTLSESNDSSSSANTNDHLETDHVDLLVTSSSSIPLEALSHLTGETVDSEPLPTTTTATPFTVNDFHVEGPFTLELNLVSLIHQKALVIAELKWDGSKNPNQEYLITWELTDGGLKGHLLTSTTSVTLSLWPDTMYSLQVEEFYQNLDSDGEQPNENAFPSLKSVPLIVDTSTASFPLGASSPHLTSSNGRIENYGGEEEDEYGDKTEHLTVDTLYGEEEEQNGNENEEGEILAHKSFMNLPNTSSILCIAVMSTLLVLIALLLGVWARLRITSSSSHSLEQAKQKMSEEYFSGEEIGTFNCANRNICSRLLCCIRKEKEPRLLSSQDDFYNAQMMGYSFFSSNKKYKLGGQADCGGMEAPVTPVAVISSSSSLSSGRTSDPTCPLFHYYPYSNGHELPSSSTSPSSISYSQGNSMRMKGDSASVGDEGLIKASEQEYTSSSCWLPNATCTNNSSAATNNPTAATSTSSPVTTSW